jgi:hypothetical protein
MDDKNFKRERRRQARLERLGSNHPQCLFCSENDPGCLEQHHLAGSTFGSDCVIVCRNHHRKLSDKQHEHPSILPKTQTADESRGRLLLGVADALELSKAPPQLVNLVRQTGLDLTEEGQLSGRAEGDQL